MNEDKARLIFAQALKETLGFSGRTQDKMLLKDELGLDSLSVVSLLVDIEEAMGTQIADSDLSPDNITSVGDVIRLIERYGEK